MKEIDLIPPMRGTLRFTIEGDIESTMKEVLDRPASLSRRWKIGE